MRTITQLPAELTTLLFNAGPRAIVLVEGKDDCYTLREWFSEKLAEVEFFDCGGVIAVRRWLEEVLQRGTLKRAYGITDRDFRGDEEVEQSYDPASHLFILRRYDLENYLLDPRLLREEIRLRHQDFDAVAGTDDEMRKLILNLCQQLKTLTAADWTIFEARKLRFSDGHDPEPREQVISYTSLQLNCSEDEAERRIAEKEALLAPCLANLESAYQIFKGKRLLNWINRSHFRMGSDYLRRLLVRAVKQQGIPQDILKIVHGRILP